MSDLLTITSLTAGYGKLRVLDELSLRIAAGGFHALLGPNGSGKSTLVKTIFGLTDRTGGSIQFAEREIADLAPEAVRRLGLAYVPQRDNVFKTMTVRENLLLALHQTRRANPESALVSCFGLFPILLERQHQRAATLSGGERQMLAIALGWLAAPRLMLLDEPSAGLSPLFVNEVFRTLKELVAEGLTLLVVEQNARSILRWCDYAFLMREGRVVFEGTAQDILADEETVKTYLGVGRRPAPIAGT
jgi:branched-chain amino acid transport system ATP-binding protein